MFLDNLRIPVKIIEMLNTLTCNSYVPTEYW